MRIRTLSLAVAVVVAGWLTLAPTEIKPVSWQPPKAPSTSSGVYAENSRLAGLERLGAGKLPGPEALVTDKQGRIYTGLADGRVVRLDSADGSLTTLADTAGRPLALAWHPDGRLIIADAIKGLLALAPDGKLQTLVAADGALPLGFTDFVTVSADGHQAWFSDASTRWHYGQDAEAIMEHGGDGRLLRYDFASGRTEVMLSGLEFANGVALGPNENYVLVNETGAYRISRLWLKGARKGQHDLFIDNLPGLPDNLTFNGKDRFWVALYTPRNPLLDTFAGWPGVRKAFARALQVIPKPVEHRAMALGLSLDGQVVVNLQDGAHGNYSPITTVLEADEWLYFGSLTQDGIARMPLKSAF